MGHTNLDTDYMQVFINHFIYLRLHLVQRSTHVTIHPIQPTSVAITNTTRTIKRFSRIVILFG